MRRCCGAAAALLRRCCGALLRQVNANLKSGTTEMLLERKKRMHMEAFKFRIDDIAVTLQARPLGVWTRGRRPRGPAPGRAPGRTRTGKGILSARAEADATPRAVRRSIRLCRLYTDQRNR